ncbi:hypothetical protein HK104_010003 [Borealophlyctis nickersoniae]|nr:hypothetical protein HK104_010003 [Borealophlyctis nickersoniae]
MSYKSRWQLHVAKKGKGAKIMMQIDEEEESAEMAKGEVGDSSAAGKKRKRSAAVEKEVAAIDKDGHIQSHMAEKEHFLAMDFNNCTVYCGRCEDYIYDIDLEHAMHAERARLDNLISRVKEPNAKRARCGEWAPSPEDIEHIRAGSDLQKCCGIRGLRNMGATCFMNVVLQTFIHNPFLRTYFLSDRHPSTLCSKRDDRCLACEMDKLFQNFYSGEIKPYGPTSFLYSMWKSQKHLSGYSQQDAHEFFISVLNEIHNCCTGAANHETVNCKCIVHTTFAGLLQSDVTCLKCGNVTTAHDPILDLSLDVKSSGKGGKKLSKKKAAAAAAAAAAGPKSSEEHGDNHPGSDISDDVAKGKGVRVPLNMDSTTLFECLDKFTHPEKLGATEYICSTCGAFQEATKQLSLKRLPPVLSFQLKRFEHSTQAQSKIETIVRVPAELDMTPYTTRSVKHRNIMARSGKRDSRPDSGGATGTAHTRRPSIKSLDPMSNLIEGIPTYKYKLFAVVKHQGKMDTGHYTAFTKSRGQWFAFDDATITLTTQKHVLDTNGYMCFYIRDNYEYCLVDPQEAPREMNGNASGAEAESQGQLLV